VTNDEIREIIHIFAESGMAEIEVKRGDNSVRIRRNMGSATNEIVLPQLTHVVQSAAASPAPVSANSSASTQPGALATDYIAKSPIVGTFYEAPKPGDPPFVKVGDHVEQGQVLCIIESMKLMNEIESEVGGVVVAKLMENGRPVEYGEALFAIRPR
jgi:acetyl-CoA carboxylase biotin carboxyl carrier protein